MSNRERGDSWDFSRGGLFVSEPGLLYLHLMQSQLHTCSYQSDSVASSSRGLEKVVSIEIRELPDFVNPSPMMFLLIKYWKKISEGAATLSLNYLEKIRSPALTIGEASCS